MSDAERQAVLDKLAKGREKAPTADPDAIKERNRKALEARKAAVAQKKAEEAKKELPEGWRRVESRSRPGEYVYENIHTEERQAWFPDKAASEEVAPQLVAQAGDDKKKEEIKKKNAAALAAFKAKRDEQKKKEMEVPPPAGWKRVESRSRPGEFVYENEKTGERQAWYPEVSDADLKKQEKLEKNKAALELFKAKAAAKKAAESLKQADLPDGWAMVESRSRPGEFVYENIYTEERQAWVPDAPAEKPLPEGWKKVESRSRPGEFVYENIHTGERQAWAPTETASTFDTQDKTTPQERTEKQLAEMAENRAPPPRQIVCKAKAEYDYAATNEEEIDLLEGDVVAVEFKADNGWWVGINLRTRRNGIFPGAWVVEIK